MKPVLAKENIHLNQSAATQEEAIRLAGKALVDAGYVTAEYIEKMLEREGLTSTYMGNAIAIPHGTEDSKQDVLHSGISVIQLPEGVEYGDGNIAKVIFGIAGKNDEHLEILSKIAIVCSEADNVERIINAKNEDELMAVFEEGDQI
ncbi:PTS sugar transporter subunit IIA [Bacillus haynesii]|uniref:PTS sugar transporter subunit IIA n=1 Tax=Bacillus haynesii TaxID=1925021 RepID=UPI00227FD26A|nr:PTS sugar transporter subunit IIA [Bacillus haynesii]MCY7817675.1 PTS sugar transporter subunit IIA [Bacillus haynesii]MCY8243356.1 PTS sugar transporter subunit IIA [Bacillus haynesii]MCY8569783.1 PTS sugar transporter subunit IIA [Bacillus haynesii]MCY8664809.1 PTS sugar transporter subunit IIA [Bacillus haynesii]MEC1347685.1 PTS sugar transporter subunit IIA [Bacillus haynesii]